MKKILLHTALFGVLLLIVFVSCKQKQKITLPTEDTIVVKTVSITATHYAPALEYSGMIATTNEAKLSFKVAGIISRIFVNEGDHVMKGQLLAALDLTEISAQVRQASQNAEKLGRDEQRVKNLFEDTAATLEQYQNVQTQVSIAKENLRIAEFNRQYAQIRASAGGMIYKKVMNEGEMASTGSTVLILNGTSDNDWVIRFGVSDKDWAVLRKGDKANVYVDAYPGKTFTGIISKIEQAADPANGTYEIEVKIFPGDSKFAAGLFSTVHIHANHGDQELTMIPVESLSEADRKTGYVYSLNADKKTVTRHKVQIAFIAKDSVGIINGLDNINDVIKEGASYLTENARVKLITD